MGRSDGCWDECKKLLDTYCPIESDIPVLPNEKCLNHGLCNVGVMGVSQLMRDDFAQKVLLNKKINNYSVFLNLPLHTVILSLLSQDVLSESEKVES